MRYVMVGLIAIVLVALIIPRPAGADEPLPPPAAKRAAPDPIAGPAVAATPAPLPSEFRVVQDHPDRLFVELPNRLLVVAQEVHTAPVVSVQAWVKTGSVFEQEHVGAGLSHFLEHLLAGGSTKSMTEEEGNKVLGTIGARVNAQTGMDNVHYYINTSRPFAKDAIALMSDWMQHNLITPTEYERERTVIQREFEMGEGEPARILWKLTQMERYSYHPARHPTIGYLDEFKRITRDQIYDFYRRMYVPNNMIFVVTGDIDRRAVVEQVAALWKDAKVGELPRIELPIEPAWDKPREKTGYADIKRPQLRIAWPGTSLGEEHDYALDLLARILGDGETSRLVRVVRDEKKLVNTIDASNLSMSWGKGYFGVDAEVVVPQRQYVAAQTPEQLTQAQKDAVEKAKAAILEEVRRAIAAPVTAEELARAKRQTLAAAIYSAQTAEGLASRLASDLISMGDPDYLQRYADAVQAITAEDIQKAGKAYLDTPNFLTVTMLPRPETMNPAPLTRPAEVPGIANVKMEPKALDNAAVLDRLAALPPLASGNGRGSSVGKIDRFVLPNGLRVLISRSTTIPAVSMQLYTLGGSLADEPDRLGIANATATMQIKGTTTRTAKQIAETIENLGAGLSTDCGANTSYSTAICLKDDWEKVLELMADVNLNPTFPDEEWGKLQPRMLAAIDRMNDTWTGELRQRFLAEYYGKHQWSKPAIGSREVVASLSAAHLRRFFADHQSASNTVLAIFGDIDPGAVRKKVETLFGPMQKDPLLPFKAAEHAKVTPELVQFKTNKPLAAVMMGYGPGVSRTSVDYPAVSVLARLLNSFPSGWLENELRGEHEGLVYAVGAGRTGGLVAGYFSVVFNCTPAKLPEALGRARGVVERAKNDPASAYDLARAKAVVLTDEFLDKQTNSDRAADAAINELYGLGDGENERFLKAVQAVTPESLQIIAQTYLSQPVTVVMTHEPLDEKVLNAASRPAD